MCRTLVREDFCFFSAKRALRAASQSNTEWTGRALKGDRAVVALRGESIWETAGLGGSLRLGKPAAPVGGADMGAEVGKGLGGTTGAVAGGDMLKETFELVLVVEVGEELSHLHEQSDCLLLAVSGRESGVVWPEPMAGELRDMALERKSV